MSKIKVNEIDSRSGTDITVTTGKTLVVPAGGTLDISAATLTPPAVMPASSAANLTNVPGANITGTIPSAALGNVDTTGLQDDIALLAFKTQANGSLARYNLVDQSVDAFEDASGVDAGASTNEARNASNYYYGESASAPVVSGNYDSATVDGDYTYYKWTTVTSSGTYTTDTAQDYEYLVVAGGGSGAHANSGTGVGAGGAGGMRFNGAYNFPVAATTISNITVGAGGAAQGGGDGSGVDGNDSIFSTITSTAGGAGRHNAIGNSGGSGGGSGNGYTAGQGNTPSTSPAQGSNSGTSPSGSYHGGAGGGGHSAVGGNGSPGTSSSGGNGGVGGAGTANSITGSSVTYAGGGGGVAGYTGGTPAPGGGGGGGAGGNTGGTPGTANTGGGGGSTRGGQTSGAGGSGIVIIKRLTGTDVEGANMTLVSTAQTAQAQPTKGDIVVTYTNGTGTTTLDTDLIASVSRDNGTTYTAVPLTLQGTTGGHNIATGHDVVISGQPAGTSMRWKMVTANQAVGKTTRIHAVSLGWS